MAHRDHSAALRARRAPNRTAALPATGGFARCRRKFLRIFPGGFRDENYLDWERSYRVEAHREWEAGLGQAQFRKLLKEEKFEEIAGRVVRIESGRSLLFSFEKMALRDAVRSGVGAKAFATGLFTFLHGAGSPQTRFETWCETVAGLPRKQTRVLTWPIVTVFGFIAQPRRHIFLKPNTTKEAARKCGFDFPYRSRPDWPTYSAYLEFASQTRESLRDLRPRDMIDIQSFLWVQGSDEYS
ncbi:MAG TPA: hypothetical protein VGF97_15430 [Rhizomicrobium sp.]